MLTFSKFAGINNVQPGHRLTESDLVVATDVDIGLSGELARRVGFTEVSPVCHKNLHQGAGFMLATTGGALTAIWPNGDRPIIHPSLGFSRVWYCNLPDGRTTFSNGLIHGVTDGLALSDWSIPAPELAAPTQAHGVLSAGSYRYYLTFVRLSDGLEGPAVSSVPFDVTLGGVRLAAIPQREGYAVNVYLSGEDGVGAYLAGTTTTDEFVFAGANYTLVLPCRTLDARPMPIGTLTASWRGRILVAQGNVLWASMPGTSHLCLWSDFRQFGTAITAICPVDDGIYIGLQDDLVFLGGDKFDALTFLSTGVGGVVPGSGITAPGDQIKVGDGVGRGTAMLCIADGGIVAGLNSGSVVRMTAGRYHTDAAEVAATWRMVGDVPQYIAVPQ